MDSVRVTEAAQALIDSRLDTIDRMLLGRLPRGERLEIVREVESQIFELLQERSAGEPTREDVLAVLQRLDPPEAYLADDIDRASRPAVGRRSASMATGMPIGRSETISRPRFAIVGGIVGIVAIAVLFLAYPVVFALAQSFNGNTALVLIGFFAFVGLALIGGVIAVTFSVQARLRSSWAITGLVTGIIALLGSLVSSGLIWFL